MPAAASPNLLYKRALLLLRSSMQGKRVSQSQMRSAIAVLQVLGRQQESTSTETFELQYVQPSWSRRSSTPSNTSTTISNESTVSTGESGEVDDKVLEPPGASPHADETNISIPLDLALTGPNDREDEPDDVEGEDIPLLNATTPREKKRIIRKERQQERRRACFGESVPVSRQDPTLNDKVKSFQP